MNVKIREAVRETREVTIQVRPDLWIAQCDGCGRKFKMGEWCNENRDAHFSNATLLGTFDRPAPGEGNTFRATICSFKCAHRVMVGGWQTMGDYKMFAEIGATLVRCETRLTSLVQSEEEVLAEWEAAAPTAIPNGVQIVERGPE